MPGVGLLLVTLVSGGLQAMGDRSLRFGGHTWSLDGMSGVLIYHLEIAAALLLFGAQVIAEYERFGRADAGAPPKPMRTA